jgi:uncharacterized protein (TIGR03437 family)
VTYAGGVPGEVAGLMQLNVQIPANLLPPNATAPVSVPVVFYNSDGVFVGYNCGSACVTITVAP